MTKWMVNNYFVSLETILQVKKYKQIHVPPGGNNFIAELLVISYFKITKYKQRSSSNETQETL